MKIVRMRCTGCDSRLTFVDQELDVCRVKVCERCAIKLTVVSSEGQIDPPVVPPRERAYLTNSETETAKRLLVTAFAEKE